MMSYSVTVVITTIYPKVHKCLILVTFMTRCKAAYSDHLTILQGHYNCMHLKVSMEIFMLLTVAGIATSRILVHRLFPPAAFDHLQYANTEAGRSGHV